MEEYCEIPNAVIQKANKATESLLPVKSREVYEKEYSLFQRWMEDNSVDCLNEVVLLAYFEDLSKSFSPNSLWSKYSMLKRTLLVNNNVEIIKFYKLVEFLKQRSKGYEAKKSKNLTRDEVLQFINKSPNETYLMLKVALLFGIFGGCRRHELVGMLAEHVEDKGSVFVVTIPETKTDKKRVFTITDDIEMNSLKLIRDYVSLRPKYSVGRFFLNYRHGRCTAQPVGKNTFGKIPFLIAKYLGLADAEKYTGHCLRRTSATLLAETGTNTTLLKKHGGWKSASFTENHFEDPVKTKQDISGMQTGESSMSITTTSSRLTRSSAFINSDNLVKTKSAEDVLQSDAVEERLETSDMVIVKEEIEEADEEEISDRTSHEKEMEEHLGTFDMVIVKEEIEEVDEEVEMSDTTCHEEKDTPLDIIVKNETEEPEEEDEEEEEEEEEDLYEDGKDMVAGKPSSSRAGKKPQRAYIKLCVDQGKSAKETVDMLREAFGRDAMGRSPCYCWHARFRAGETSLEDMKRSGRPRVSFQNLPKVQRIVAADPSLSFREIGKISGLTFQTCCRYMEELNLQRVCGKLVPKLTLAEKRERTNICVDLRTAAHDDPTYISRIISCGESWFYGCHSILKGKSRCKKCQQSKSGIPWPKKPQSTLPSRSLLIVFFDIKGIVHWEFSPCTDALSAEMYCEILSRLRKAVLQKRPLLGQKSSWMLHHDNSPAYNDLLTREFLATNNVTVVPHPQNSSAPDLIPWDCALMEGLKMRMKARAVKNPEKYFAVLKKDLCSLKTKDFQEAFQEIQANWELCINSLGDYCNLDEK